MPRRRHVGGFRWEQVDVEAYKPEGAHFRDVCRQVLFRGGAGELRYFEIAPAGWTTLERHEHVHEVMVLRGNGRALCDGRVQGLEPFDLLVVPPLTWHQLRAGADGPLGFLCLVPADRDRPERPGADDLVALRADPELSEFIRA